MDLAQEYLEMMRDTADLIAKDKAVKLGNTASGFQSSYELTNEVEFWKWMGKNYPKDLSTSELIQRAANEKSRWLNTQIQGKGYEWDYMSSQRANPTNLLSKFDAGDCPTQPGIDITKSNIVDGSVEASIKGDNTETYAALTFKTKCSTDSEEADSLYETPSFIKNLQNKR